MALAPAISVKEVFVSDLMTIATGWTISDKHPQMIHQEPLPLLLVLLPLSISMVLKMQGIMSRTRYT